MYDNTNDDTNVNTCGIIYIYGITKNGTKSGEIHIMHITARMMIRLVILTVPSSKRGFFKNNLVVIQKNRVNTKTINMVNCNWL